ALHKNSRIKSDNDLISASLEILSFAYGILPAESLYSPFHYIYSYLIAKQASIFVYHTILLLNFI
ncbi:MAG: hypothetical protein UDQ48_00525, partial [Dialister sp.]|uniref:hypothetical protein n=1 Tax=Dialister sp. TaxID=1955814 RepID=UPI002E7A0D51